MVKPKRRRSQVADYTCFGVAAGAPDVIHGEQIAPRHKMHAWLFLNRSPSRRWWYGHSNCDTCVVMQRWHNVMRLLWHRDTCHVSRYTGHDYVICIAILRSRYNTRIVGPSIAMHRCIVTTLLRNAGVLALITLTRSDIGRSTCLL